MDLSGQNLAQMDLAGADFRGADLTGTRLSFSDLSGADLSEHDLEETRLAQVILRGASLKGARLPNTELRGMDLSGADLRDAVFDGSDLSGSNLSGTKAAGAKFRGSNLSSVNLSDADLSGAVLRNTILRRAQLTRATLRKAFARGADFSLADLEDADLQDADLQGAGLTSMKVVRANFQGANLTDANTAGTDFSGANMKGMNVPEPHRDGPLHEHYKITAPTSPAFERWFGKSVTIDPRSAQPVVVYHGTRTGGFTVFDPSKLDAHHNAFYFSAALPTAETYTDARKPHKRPDPGAEPNAPVGIYRLYIKLVNPMVVECHNAHWDQLSDYRAPGLTKTFELAKWAQAHRHDGVIFKNILDDGGHGPYRVNTPATVYAVFDPTAIKSATANNGNYDPRDPDIRHNPRRSSSRAPRRR
jgi:uncharacterized protein YjbI with pentapeptide repeats